MNKRREACFFIPAVLLIFLLCYSLIQALRIYIPMQREQRAFDALKMSVSVSDGSGGDAQPSEESGPAEAGRTEENPVFQYEQLLRQNADFVGWLTIPDTLIDYPVMKSAEDDPQYYLRRDFWGEDSYSGCLFIGGGCDAESESFIIYGHNMHNDSMFGTLDRYADYNYAVSHPEIYFSTPQGERIYRVFAAFQTRVYQEQENVFKYYEEIGTIGQEEYEQTVESVRRLSLPALPDAPVWPAQLLFLSTCSYHTEDGRFVAAAYRIA